METQEQQKPQIVSVTNPYLLRLKCFICQAPNLNINDENNNLKKDQNTNEKSFNPISKLPLYTCPECEAKIRLEEKETASSSTVTSQEFEGESDRMIIVPDTSSDDDNDECCCQSCTDDEHDSNYRQLWDDLSHTIKCVYRQTDREFSETHFVDNICKAKDYVKKLTDINSQRLFTKLESIVFEYVREIRNQVLERFHTCSKTSHDVQLFISFLLDEYHIFIQAATNVSTILSYLEEQYMKSFHLTWLLYNKHLYEKLIYMNKKIQHSMSTMIDLLQPTNDDNDYSPAEYTQLLNRFLAFDEEMSEIACLYKDSQEKSKLPAFDVNIQNGYSTENKIKINKKKKKCKKVKKTKQLATSSTEANTNSSSTTAVDIPSSNTSSSVPVPPEQGSNGSSIGSGIGGDESSSSSVSSVDDYLLDHETSSSGYTQEEHEDLEHLFTEEDLNELLLEGILDGVSPIARMHHEILQSRLNEKQTDPITTTIDNDKWIEGIIQGIQSVREREQKTTDNDIKTTVHCTTTKEGLNVPLSSESSSKKSSSIKSKSNKSSHRRKETSTQPTTTTSQIPRKSIAADLILPRSIADLSAKIQSVSFTAGTFGSITSTNPNECYHSSSSSSSSSNCSTTTLTAAKTTTATGQTRLSINLTRKPGSKTTEHGGQKIAEALLNELTGLGNGECLNSGRKKDNQQFKKTKQQRSTINETLLNSTNNPHSFFNSSTKCDSHSSSSSSSSASSSSAAQFNLDHLLRNAASNTDVSEAALHSILSSFHSQTSLDASSLKHPISSKASEALQTLLAQQQQHHHHHHHHYQQQKRNLSNNTNKLGEFCCCEFSEGRTCSASSTCLHLSSTSNTNNGPITSCVTCMALPGTTTTTTTTSVMGATITGAFNQRNVDMKERLKLKFAKRNVQNLTEQHTLAKDQQKKTTATTATAAAAAASTAASTKKPTTTTTTQNSPKTKECLNNDKNDIDDLVRFIDGNETISSNHNEHQISITTTTTTNESTSKKNKKKKDKQLKIDHTEEVKSNTSQPKEQQQQTNQKKQNGPTTSQLTTSPQPPSRSASSSSSTKAASVASSSTSIVEAQQPLSKRKLKAKLKLEQQQKQATNNKEPSAAHSHTSATTINPTPASIVSVAMLPASYSSSQGTNTPRTSVDLPSESFDMPEEEVNWITISRKQSKHKPSPASVPSLLAAPILPVVPPTNNKQHRQQQTTVHTKKTASTVNGSSLAQQKVTLPTVVPSTISSEAVSTSTKQQQQTTIAPSALQNVLKNHTTYQPSKVEPQAQLQPPLNLWNINNIHDHTLVTSPAATLLPTSSSSSSSYISTHSVPSSSPATSVGLGSTSTIPSSSSILSEGLSSSLYWDPNGYILPSTSQSTIIPSTVPGPVQRPSTSFSPAPGPVHNTTSRCIQRPSPEPRSCSTNNIPFPLYSPMNYAASSSTSSWNDTPVTNTHESQWGYSQEQQQLRSSTTPTDFPLYDPFHSGARLTIPSTTLLPNGFSEHYTDLCIVPQDNDINEMDALDKEIEDFKKFCFENVPLETREKVQANIECCFVRQA